MPKVIQPHAIHWLGVLLLGIVWGGSFLGIAVALQGFSPEWVATGRLAIGSLTLGLVGTAIKGRLAPKESAPTPWGYVAAIGLLSSAAPFLLLSWGLQFVPTSFAGISMAAVALFILPLAHFFVPGEAMTTSKVIGVGAGFVGVVVLFGAESLSAEGASAVLGRLACLAAAGCYAVSSILTRRCPPVEPLRLARLSLLIGLIPILPVALLSSGVPTEFSVVPVTALIILGVLPTGLAIFMRVLLIRSAGPGFTSLTSYLVPVWAVIYGAILLAEPVPPQMLLALTLILGGIAVTQAKTLSAVVKSVTKSS